MTSSTHPLARSDDAIRLREHTLVEIGDLLGADSFSLVDEEVTFTRRAVGDQPAMRWVGRLGDWLVSDGQSFWRIVSDPSGSDRPVLPDEATTAQPRAAI